MKFIISIIIFSITFSILLAGLKDRSGITEHRLEKPKNRELREGFYFCKSTESNGDYNTSIVKIRKMEDNSGNYFVEYLGMHYIGVGFVESNKFTFGFSNRDKVCGVAIFNLEEDNKLNGKLIMNILRKKFTETWTFLREDE